MLIERRAETMLECAQFCNQTQECLSVNYKLLGQICELNRADVHIAPHNYLPARGYVYLDNPWPKVKMKSCASIKDIVSNAESGYYCIELFQEKKEVFCDMINFGGGWTLVASISSSNNNHLLRTEVNCLLPNRCVENVSSDIPTRKMSDKYIHAIATTEGTFRVDQVSNGFTAFFKIPIGAHLFNSECFGASCPRIIVSHSYPYQWESNCKGTELGYQVTDTPNRCYRVFDMHDNGECGHTWRSTKYGTNRVLYGFPCSSFSGIYKNKQGLLFVK